MFGCRTVFSMKDDETWRLSQRGGGWISVVCGGSCDHISLYVSRLEDGEKEKRFLVFTYGLNGI